MRRIFFHEFDRAKEVLQSIAASLPENEQATVASWQQQVHRFATAEQENQVAKAALAKKSHLNELRKRRDRASQGGDTASTERYDALINAATQEQ